MGCTALPHPAHSPDLAPSYCHLFGPVKDAICERYFAENNEMKQSFSDVVCSGGRIFYNTGISFHTQRWQKCAVNDENFVEK
jgi:hypothetical protein